MKITYQRDHAHGFYPTLTSRVDQFFTAHGISRYATPTWYLKIAVMSSLTAGTYAWLLVATLSAAQVMATYFVLGALMMLSGINIVHDAVHNAIVRPRWVNKAFLLFANLIGGNGYIWQMTHVYAHHTFPNVPHVDVDLLQSPVVRVIPGAKHRWIHRAQHIYMLVLYFFYSFFWAFARDFKHFSLKRIGNKNANHHVHEYVVLISSKAAYFTYTLVIPYLLLHITLLQLVASFLLLHVGMSAVVIFVLLSNHVQEENPYPEPDANGVMPTTWAEHQVITTCDYLTDSRVLTYLFGGMNHHLAHHLFPDICHVHLPYVTRIVRDTAAEFGLNYKCKRWDILASHFKLLKMRSVPDLS